MKQLLNIIAFGVLLICCNALAANSQVQNSFTSTTELKSINLAESRAVNIQLPTSYYQNKQQSYPVLYVLDGDNLQSSAEFTQSFLASKQHIPEMIIVSIPHTGERTRDFSPYFRHSGKKNQGATNFIDFLKGELIPFINKTYRASDYRILAGHSQSGLFVIHSLIQEPNLFKARFAFSPSLHHTPKLQQDIKDFLSYNNTIDGFLYTNVGGSEFFKIKDAIELTKQSFIKHPKNGLRVVFDYNEFDGHQSTPNIGFHKALKSLYKPHKLDFGYSQLSYSEIISHFKATSQEFGQTIKPRISELQSMQRYYFSVEPNVEVLKRVHRIMKHYYPNKQLVDNNSLFYINWLTYGTDVEFDYSQAKPDESVLHKLAYSKAVNGEFETAMFVIDLAIVSYPMSYKPLEYKAKLLERKGDAKHAVVYYKRALSLDVIKSPEEVQLYKQKIELLNSHGTGKSSLH